MESERVRPEERGWLPSLWQSEALEAMHDFDRQTDVNFSCQTSGCMTLLVQVSLIGDSHCVFGLVALNDPKHSQRLVSNPSMESKQDH